MYIPPWPPTSLGLWPFWGAVSSLSQHLSRDSPENHGMTILPNMKKRVDFPLVMCYI